MSDGESIAGREREVTFHTPGALSREQVEKLCWDIRSCDVLGNEIDDMIAHVAALRATITQQAQELAESERKLREVCMAHGPALLELYDLKKELEEVQLRRSETVAMCEKQAQELERMKRELGKAHMERVHWEGLAMGTNPDAAQLAQQVAQLQATLAAREAEIVDIQIEANQRVDAAVQETGRLREALRNLLDNSRIESPEEVMQQARMALKGA